LTAGQRGGTVPPTSSTRRAPVKAKTRLKAGDQWDYSNNPTRFQIDIIINTK
jgi:hypothetical protein